MSQAAIVVKNLTRDFKTVRALDNLSLSVPQGIIFGFLGPNGAGKTTAINILLGLVAPTSGKAEVLGFDVTTQADDIRARSGALLEHPGLYEQLSAEDNLEFYGRVCNLDVGLRRDRIRQQLTSLGVWERRQEQVGTWSRGMKQKLALARALLHRPPLVFLDEPTAGLDVVAAAAVRDDLAALASDEGVTVFLTTHNMAEVERLCHQVAVIREGKLVALDHPDELRAGVGRPQVDVLGRGFTEPVLNQLRAHPEVAGIELKDNRLSIYLKEQMGVAPLVSLIVAAGVEVEEVRKGRTSLEEVFLTLMEEEP